MTDREAAHAGKLERSRWRAAVSKDRVPRGTDFLSRQEFGARLARDANRYGFTVESVRFIERRGRIAPFVVVRTDRYVAFSLAMAAIDNSLDPLHGSRGKAQTAFWAFFLQANDERGVPFLGVDSDANSDGQWARSDQLFPFARG
ncbi:MAG TPA: hypothetical protein VGH79_12270 [Gaiellaceae bacterium]